MTDSAPRTTRKPQPRGPVRPSAPRPSGAAGRRAAYPPRPGRSPRTPASGRLLAALARSRAWARPAGTGARLAAYTIDWFLCVVISGVVGGVLRSPVIGVLVFIEAGVILLLLESRTGLTLGNLLLGQRTTRDDAPFSPGVGRGVVRGIVLGAGSLVALVGGWIVVATSAADPNRMGRSLADRAGRTLVVKVPTRAERAAWERSAEEWVLSVAAPQQQVEPAQQMQQMQQMQPAPSQYPQFVQPVLQAPNASQFAQPLAQPPVRPVVPQAPEGQPPLAQPVSEQQSSMPDGVVSVEMPIAQVPPRTGVEETLLLTFDTGQREQLRIPTVVNIGRKPVRSEADDQVVAVQDPDGSVSKTHLRLEYRGDSVWVCDLGSTNGSEVVDDTGEAVALSPRARVRLEDGASLRIGSRSFTVAVISS